MLLNFLFIALLGTVICCLIVIAKLRETQLLLKQLETTNETLLSQKKSSEIVTGHISEKLAPLTKQFKYNPRNAVFIGMPIDYIVFEDDKIVFVEIKSGASKLTSKQKSIKKLIDSKLVEWETIRITGDSE